jgi:hypothetical protein
MVVVDELLGVAMLGGGLDLLPCKLTLVKRFSTPIHVNIAFVSRRNNTLQQMKPNTTNPRLDLQTTLS